MAIFINTTAVSSTRNAYHMQERGWIFSSDGNNRLQCKQCTKNSPTGDFPKHFGTVADPSAPVNLGVEERPDSNKGLIFLEADI